MTENNKKRNSLKNKPYALLRIIGILLILGLVAFRYNLLGTVYKNNQKFSSDAFSQNIGVRDYVLQNRLETYADALYTSRALFLVDGNVTRQDWTNFVEAQRLQQRYPGLYAIAYVSVINRSQEPGLLNQLNANRYPNETRPINIYPASSGTQLAVLTYIAPANTDQSTIGYDLYADPVRTATLDKARDTGAPEITKPLALLSDKTGSPTNALIAMPVYDSSKPTATLVERRTALNGFVVMALHTKPLLDSVFKYGDRVNVNVSAAGQSIYQLGSPPKSNDIKKTVFLNVGGQVWRLDYSAPASFELANTAKLTPTLLILSVVPLLIFYFLAFYFSIKFYVLRRHHKNSHHSSDSDHDIKDFLK